MLTDDTHSDKWEKETFVVNVCRTGGLVLLTLSACYGDGGADTSNITPKGDALTVSDKVKIIHITQAMIDNSLSDVSAFQGGDRVQHCLVAYERHKFRVPRKDTSSWSVSREFFPRLVATVWGFSAEPWAPSQ